jgi:dTMP kinase
MSATFDARTLAGKFIVLDGPDGCGKTTQQHRLVSWLNDAGVPAIACRDPGGTEIGDRIRHVLLDFDLAEMHVRCETLLFMASRAQLVGTVIAPALAAGKCVVCSRFVSSTCAYQGAAGADVHEIVALGRHAVGETWPHLTIVLDVPIEEGFRRTGRPPKPPGRVRHAGQKQLFDGASTDAMEARPIEFHRRVRELLLDLPAFYPTPVTILDANASVEVVHGRIVEAIAGAKL